MKTLGTGVTDTRDWSRNRQMWVGVLEKSTGKGVEEWVRRIETAPAPVKSESGLRAWLTKQGVTGYAQQLLVMERFGYPDYLVASAAELIDRQYADRPELRAIYEAILASTRRFGAVAVQARKTYVSLVTPRRTFARVVPRAKRIDLGLRMEGQRRVGRLESSTIHETMRLQIVLQSRAEVDDEVVRWLPRLSGEPLTPLGG
jgi:Domain of unknown function (DUF5655)